MLPGLKRWGSGGSEMARGIGAFLLGITALSYLGSGRALLGLAIAVPVVATIARVIVRFVIKGREGGIL